jgi:hypothetical protein
MPYQDKDPQTPGVGGKFEWKTTVVSPGVRALVGDDPIVSMTVTAFLRQHHSGLWGSVSSEEAAANEQALTDGTSLFSRHHLKGHEIWILTDAEPREVTNVLLPDEYEAPTDGT